MNGGAGQSIVVVAASAGGVEALRALLPLLPADLPAAMLVVLHIPAAGGTALPRILDRAGPLPASAALDGEPVRPGRIYVAPPSHHMLVRDNTIRLSAGPPYRGHRPAADPLFFSAALAAGPRAIAVVLSGTLNDGAVGCAAVERHGGLVLIQDPAECAYQGMPRSALAAARHPLVLTLREIADRIAVESWRQDGAGRPGQNPETGIASSPGQRPGTVTEPVPSAIRESVPDLERLLRRFLDSAQADPGIPFDLVPPATARPAAKGAMLCPACGRPLHDLADAPLRFACPADHAWSAQSLSDAQAAAITRVLWTAVFRLEDRATSSRLLADAAEGHGQLTPGRNFRSTAIAASAASAALRKLLNWATRAGVADPDGDGSS
jgi:two-component system, chemotaxis family, protein-glutamate methylesterase/glutaminase